MFLDDHVVDCRLHLLLLLQQNFLFLPSHDLPRRSHSLLRPTHALLVALNVLVVLAVQQLLAFVGRPVIAVADLADDFVALQELALVVLREQLAVRVVLHRLDLLLVALLLVQLEHLRDGHGVLDVIERIRLDLLDGQLVARRQLPSADAAQVLHLAGLDLLVQIRDDVPADVEGLEEHAFTDVDLLDRAVGVALVEEVMRRILARLPLSAPEAPSLDGQRLVVLEDELPLQDEVRQAPILVEAALAILVADPGAALEATRHLAGALHPLGRNDFAAVRHVLLASHARVPLPVADPVVGVLGPARLLRRLVSVHQIFRRPLHELDVVQHEPVGLRVIVFIARRRFHVRLVKLLELRRLLLDQIVQRVVIVAVVVVKLLDVKFRN